MYRVVTLRSLWGREVVVEMASGFVTVSDALDYCEEHDPESSGGFRAELCPALESELAA